MRTFFIVIVFLASSLSIRSQNVETVIQRSGRGASVALAVSSDGVLLADVKKSNETDIEIWNTKTGHFVRLIKTGGSNNFGDKLVKSITQLHFWKGSRFLVTGTFDGIHEIYDIQTGKKVKSLCSQSFISGVSAVNEKNGSFVAIHPLSFAKNQLIYFDLFNNMLYDSVSLDINGISAMEFSPDGKNLAIGTEDGSLHIVELSTYNRIAKAEKVHPSKIKYLQWTPDNYLLMVDSSFYTFWNLNENKVISNKKINCNTSVVASPLEDCFYMANDEGIRKITGEGVVQKSFGINPDNIRKICYFDNKLYVLTENFIRTFDLNNVNQTACDKLSSYTNDFLFPEKRDKWFGDFSFIAVNKSMAYTSEGKFLIKRMDTVTSDELLNIDPLKLKSIAFINHKNFVYSLTDNNPSGIFINEGDKNSFMPSKRNEQILFVSPSGRNCICVSDLINRKDTILSIYDLIEKKCKNLQLSGRINCGCYSPSQKQFAVGGDKLYLFDSDKLKYQRLFDEEKEVFHHGFGNVSTTVEIPENYRQLCFSPDGKKLFAASNLGQLKIWDLATFRIDTVYDIYVKFMVNADKGNRVFVAADNEILIINSVNNTVEASIVLTDNCDYIICLPDNYYRSSRNGPKAVVFRKGAQTFSFDQFDLVYNHPEIVTQRIGNSSPAYLEALKKANAKRIKKMEYTEDLLMSAELNAPEARIKDYKSIPTTTKNKDLQFSFVVSDKMYFIKKFFVYVNGVPSGMSSKGYELSLSPDTRNRKEILVNYSLPLCEGKNLIEVSSMNEKGVESLKESFEIYYTPEVIQKPDLYLIMVGASKYEDSVFNLKYPVKDAKDIADAFSQRTDMFGNIHIVSLYDSEVSADAVRKLKDTLLKTDVSDYVMVFWSGHGLLSKDFNYFLATYNTDFNNPEIKGLDYSSLENILDSILARKKCLFIDACHSGEVDKDELEIATVSKTDDGVVKSKGIKVVKQKDDNAELKNTFVLMQELFTDVRRGSGANVISAAGGAEFAFEGDQWHNGVFTYVLLNGLKNKKADINSDGKIMLSELQEYLENTVYTLTLGKQKPTSRKENIYSDFQIW